MSGGSFEYLYCADSSNITERMQSLEEMADFLGGLGYAPDAAAETYRLLLVVRQHEVRVDTLIQRLTEVWRAAEWWQSDDSGEGAFKVALAKYRSE